MKKKLNTLLLGHSGNQKKLFVYWIAACIVLAIWSASVFLLDWWLIYRDTWPVALVMIFGSFIAGATAEGGGAVAFPVFTKLFGIAPEDAKLFSFMIQSVGMTMAGLVIYLREIKILWNVVFFTLFTGSIGLILGELFLNLPDPLPKLVFTGVASIFGVFLVINRWSINGKTEQEIILNRLSVLLPIAITGFIGGLVSSVIGVGLDMILFIVLTLLYGIHEKISTPTTVVLMGLLSVVGFVWHAGYKSGISLQIWQFWITCIPVVIFGAPLGAWLCEKISRDQLIILLLVLILIEVITTLWLIPLNATLHLVMLTAATLCSALFYLMIRYRTKYTGSNRA